MSDPYELIEMAELATDFLAKREALENAIAQLEKMDDSSADIEYALGYCWYLMPDDAHVRLVQAQSHLQAALRLMPEHLYARLYLAHCYFDLKRYADALSLLDTFGAGVFAHKGQAWRDVKVAELALACVLELRSSQLVQKATQELLDRVNRVDTDSVPIAAELTTALRRLIAAPKP
jgi:tetratricopeptide (TPR) repeat protein